MKRFTALALVLILLPAMAAASVLPFRTLPDYSDMPDGFSMTLSAQATAHMPFGEERLSWLNALLRHLSMQIISAGERERLCILVDGMEALSADLQTENDLTYSAWSFDPATVYTGLIQDLPQDTGTLYGLTLTEHDLMDQVFAVFEDLPTAYGEVMQVSKVNSELKGYGILTSKQQLIIDKKDTELLESLPVRLSALCKDATLRESVSRLVFSGRQVFTLLSDAEGNLLKVSYTGVCGFPDDQREVSLNWQHVSTEGKVRNKLTLKTPTASAKARNNLVVEEKTVPDGAGETWTGTYKYEVLSAGLKTVLTADVNLHLEEETLSGKVSFQQNVGSDPYTRILLEPALHLTERNAEGTVKISQYSRKNLLEGAVITLAAQSGASLSRLNTEQAVSMTDTVRERLLKQAVRALIRPLVLLPEEDTLYLSRDLSEEAWSKIAAAATLPELEEVPE